jgi:hypothetical protein
MKCCTPICLQCFLIVSNPLEIWLRDRGTVKTENVVYCSNFFQALQGGHIYVRRMRSRERGPYFQLVRSYRNEEGKPRQEVLVHLGVHETPEAALSAWPTEIAHLQRIGRDQQADKLQANFEKLRALTEVEKRKG